MRWSFKLGEFAGIGVYIHATFFLLIAFIIVPPLLAGEPPAVALDSLLFMLAIFACIVLHEYGHALTARRYGIRTRDITLLPIGGVARLERMPDDPRQEFWVAVAGPAINVGIAILLFVLLSFTGGWEPLERLSPQEGSFLQRLVVVNLSLVFFNLIPAFPMDGGRILRALLATRMEYMRATQFAATLGQGLALLFGLFGLFTNPFWVFIALFVWIGASQEAAMAQMKAALAGIPVRNAMLTDFRTLSRTDTLARAVELLLAGSQQDFPVVENAQVMGLLTRRMLVDALARQGQDELIMNIMRRDVPTVDVCEMLEDVAARFEENGLSTLPVLQNGQLVGLLTMENIGEFAMIRSALRARKEADTRSSG